MDDGEVPIDGHSGEGEARGVKGDLNRNTMHIYYTRRFQKTVVGFL